MATAVLLDKDAIARACEQYGVARLRVFGSVLTERFDPARSDVDFLVEYKPDAGVDISMNLFVFRDELQRIVGRPVDLIDVRRIP